MVYSNHWSELIIGLKLFNTLWNEAKLNYAYEGKLKFESALSSRKSCYAKVCNATPCPCIQP